MNTQTILVIDSGIGGLSVTKEIRQLMPFLRIHYVADLAAFPYGTKSESEVIERVMVLTHALIPKLNPSLIVVACNTASTIVLDAVRNSFQIPIVGVVPAVKPAAALSNSGVIGVLATPGTINRAYTHSLISEYASHCKVVLHGSSNLVQLAEEKMKTGYVDMEKVSDELIPLQKHNSELDTIVLACTHFPLLRQEFSQILPNIKYWVDSGEAIARRVANLLNYNTQTLLQYNPISQLNQFIVTGSYPDFNYQSHSIATYLGKNFSFQNLIL
jgi:glutamate racemase